MRWASCHSHTGQSVTPLADRGYSVGSWHSTQAANGPSAAGSGLGAGAGAQDDADTEADAGVVSGAVSVMRPSVLPARSLPARRDGGSHGDRPSRRR